MSIPNTRVFVDRGGTFTDVVVLHESGRAEISKVPSDRAVVGELAAGRPLVFGTTVATNALLERTGVPTLLLVSQGLRDLVYIGDMARPDLFDADAFWPAPLCQAVLEIRERLDARGAVHTPLVLPELDTSPFQAVAIVLAHAHRNPIHELALAEHLRGRGLHIALGHQVDPKLGLLARVETTLVEAAITPRLRAAMRRDRIPASAQAMRSDGSLVPALELRAPDAVLSGPAGGVLAVAAVAQQAGFEQALGLDMGGTSTDLCRVEAGLLPARTGEVRVAGVRLRRPMLHVETIAAGGGSILRSDGLQLSVGPDSAGADPGPACYGRGGPPTLTDAALLAGLVDAQAFDPPLDPSAVELPGNAQDFLDLARERMAQALRELAGGADLREHALVAYGGAAGQHAAWVAQRLHISAVLIHPCASVLCAYGQALARREERASLAVWEPLEQVDLAAAWATLQVPELGERVYGVSLRVQGTDTALELDCPGQDTQDLRLRFLNEHQRRFGTRPQGTLEVVDLHLRSQAPRPPMPTVSADPFGLADRSVLGPTLLRCPTTTVALPLGWRARNQDGLLRLECVSPEPERPAMTRTPYGAALWTSRLMGVAQQAGQLLQRLARSVNIRERLDFSCALFDEAGQLVANAPHMPVHLGAMGETVRDLLAHADLDSAQAWLSNDPQAGGSHLPDLTVVSPAMVDGRRFWVASRGHHVDVGGLTPGSMPPHSTRLDQEGQLFSRVPLLSLNGAFLPPNLGECRDPETVLADLRAQVASNHHAAQALARLGSGALIAQWMAHLQDLADESTVPLLHGIDARAEERIDGLLVRLHLFNQGGRLIADFGGTEGPHPGNLNAPRAVVRAALLYVLRCVAGQRLPLNEGALRRVELRLPTPSLLCPPPGAAVVGGNVETSQRVVDLLLTALGVRSPSLGSMNNLSMGGPGWSLYETLGGGSGASQVGDGASGRQAHMTNTRITDLEVLETRLPLHIHRFSLRQGSGGAGRFTGGLGLLREIELLEGGQAALLAIPDPPRRGLQGGHPATPAAYSLQRGQRWQPWSGEAVHLEPGDRVRVESAGGAGFGSPREERSPSAKLPQSKP